MGLGLGSRGSLAILRKKKCRITNVKWDSYNDSLIWKIPLVGKDILSKWKLNEKESLFEHARFQKNQHVYFLWIHQSFTALSERSCTTLLINQPSTPSGTYTIDPDGPGLNSPFLVYCDMSSGVGVTVIGHDSESRTQVVGYNNIGSYRRVVNYTASIAQLSRLTEISLECEQFLKYECLHSRLRFYAWWVSRDGVSRTYWGGTGSNRGTNVCACGVNVPNTCADPSEKCNCNKNDAILRSDEGLLTWKQDLPVIELRFGDTQESSNEMGYHTLGKLKCSGLQGTFEVIWCCGGIWYPIYFFIDFYLKLIINAR